VFLLTRLDPKLKVVFLGTNGWYSTHLGNTSCVLVDSEKYYVVFDAGDGIYKLDNYVRAENPVKLFLSHLHFDHIVGLHAFAKLRFKQTVSIYGYKGTRDGLRIIRHPYTVPFSDLPVKVGIYDLHEGSHSLPFPVTCKLLVHSDSCLGYRVELDNRVFAYCTDTGLCNNLYELAENADLLIAECSLRLGQVEWKWPHLNPEDAANTAKQAKVKRLVLTHFDANVYGTARDRENAEAAAKKIFQKTIAAHDGLEMEF